MLNHNKLKMYNDVILNRVTIILPVSSLLF